MIIITGHVIAKPETRAELIAICAAHSQRSRAEPGCLAHNVHVDCEDQARLVFLEEWADAASVMAHFRVPASGEFVKAISALAAVPPEMTLYRAETVSPADLA
jgi:quinol monooxygenase YgiN